MLTTLRPLLHPRFRVEILDANTVFLLSEDEQIALDAPLYRELIPLLDGTRSRLTIQESLRGNFSPFDLALAFKRLGEEKLICDASEIEAICDFAFWTSCGVPAVKVAETRNEAAVNFIAVGSADVTPIQQAFESLEFKITQQPQEATITVVVTDDYLRCELEEWNRDCLKEGRTWALVKPLGLKAWLGPIFVPNETGCWDCLAHRLKGNRTVETFINNNAIGERKFKPPKISTSATIKAASNLAALMLGQWLLRVPKQVRQGTLITLDMQTLLTERHELTKRPQCRACGHPIDAPRWAPLILNSRSKSPTVDNGYRSASAEETVARFQHHVSPITGIVSSLDAYETNSALLNVHYANHPLFTASQGLPSLRASLQNTTAGKGRTAAQSKASALCEAIERYSGIFSGTESRIHATYSDLRDQAIHPAELLHFSKAQYLQRHYWNATHSSFAWIPDPFDEAQPIEWTPVCTLNTNKVRYFPTAFCFYDYKLPAEHCFCSADSNGSASGNNKEEAILQGFMELVERDAVALWWYNRLKRPLVNLESFDDEYLLAVKAEYRIRNREMWTLDLTSDLGIPTFAAVSRRMDSKEEIIQGYGSHFNPKIALSRAVTEMNQMLAHLMSGRDDPITDPDLNFWYTSATVNQEDYLLADANCPERHLSDFSAINSNDLKEDVLRCVTIAAASGLEVFVLDQTRPDIGLPVVKVIVPGLRHFWARLAPGRLYDVPVRLGWLQKSNTEDQLNPLPICS